MTINLPMYTRGLGNDPVYLCADCIRGYIGANEDTLAIEYYDVPSDCEPDPEGQAHYETENAWLREALTRFTPTRYLVYLGHDDNGVGGLVYTSETYPDLEEIGRAYPMCYARVVQAYVGEIWVDIDDD